MRAMSGAFRVAIAMSGHLPAGVALALLLVALPGPAATAEVRRNYFGDPFVRATAGLSACPVPAGPDITLDEMKAEAHSRAERGISCYQSGRCRLPNAYLYDKEIVPRVKTALTRTPALRDTSIWLLGQRRWVWLKGCVSTPGQARLAEDLARHIDDVEAVVNELTISPSKAR